MIRFQQGWRSHGVSGEINREIDGEEEGGVIQRQGEAGLAIGGRRAGRHLSHTSTVSVCAWPSV